MKNRKYLSILALVGALTLVAAACGDDDGGERDQRHGREPPRARPSTARPTSSAAWRSPQVIRSS